LIKSGVKTVIDTRLNNVSQLAGHWFRKVGEMKSLMSMSYNAKRILNNCDQDIPDSKIPSFTAGTNLVVKWTLTKL